MKSRNEQRYFPSPPLDRRSDIQKRREEFAELNRWVSARGGFITSPPLDKVMRLECLPGSTLPDELRELGYKVTETGEGERIIAGTIVERFARTSSGALELLTPGSTALVAEVRTHAGIVRILRFEAIKP